MRRRDLLAAGSLFALTGCTAPTDGGPGAEPTDDPSSGTQTATTTDAGTDWTADFQPIDIQCASAETGSASVTFDGDRIEVTGTILGSDMCYVPKLDTVTYDEMTRELVVVVEAVREADDDTACAECLSAVEYRFVATFTGGRPSRVVVKHAGEDTVRTITTATR